MHLITPLHFHAFSDTHSRSLGLSGGHVRAPVRVSIRASRQHIVLFPAKYINSNLVGHRTSPHWNITWWGRGIFDEGGFFELVAKAEVWSKTQVIYSILL